MTVAPLQLLGDERLAQMAAAGDRRAFGVLFERHRPGLERSARSIVGNEHDAVTHTVAVSTAPALTHHEPAVHRQQPQRQFAEAPRPEPQAQEATARCHHPQPDQPAAPSETSQPVLTAR